MSTTTTCPSRGILSSGCRGVGAGSADAERRIGTTELSEIELDLRIRALQRRHGYDFAQYARASFRRRVQALVDHFGLANVSQLTEREIGRASCRERVCQYV